MRPLAGLLLSGVLLVGCAALGGGGGGGDARPDRGIVGYEPLVEEGLALPPAVDEQGDPIEELRAPSLVVGEQGTLWIYAERRLLEDDSRAIVRTGTEDLETWSEREVILEDAGSPGILRLGADWHLAFEEGGQLHLAESADGLAFSETDALGEGMEPSLSPDGSGGLTVVYELGGAILKDGELLAEEAGSPELRPSLDPLGTPLERLWTSRSGDLQFHAAFEGGELSPYPFNPVLEGSGGDALSDPSNLRWGSTYVLAASQSDGLQLFISTPDNPTETF